jgi:hypothetical protein
MRRHGIWTLVLFLFCLAQAHAQSELILVQAGEKKDKDKPPVLPPPETVASDSIQPTLNPPMIGDADSSQRILLPFRVRVDVTAQPNTNLTVDEFYAVRFPDLVRGAFKIAENESPRPTDRFFVNYSYFSHITVPTLGAPFSVITFPPDNAQFTEPGTITNAQFKDINLHRTTFGFEKTFLDGNASIGLRAPLLSLNRGANLDVGPEALTNFFGSSGFVPGATTVTNATDSTTLGDLSFILKYAPINDRDVLSFGMVVTVPTGRDLRGEDYRGPHGTLLQPYAGFIRDFDRFYVHGFSSLAVSTDQREATLFFNDIGVGYRLFDRIIPTVEAHLTTPLNHRDPNGFVSASDALVLTGGVHFLVGERTSLTLAVGVPVMGPRQFETEGVVQLNFRF